MSVTERRTQDVVIIDLKGRITIDDGAEQLSDKVSSLLLRGEPKVLLNMSSVPHVDSGALGKLVSCLLRARKAHSELKLFGLTRRVLELLTITKLTTSFDIYDTEQEALASCMAYSLKR
jgi:anti-sigma B factor antagonist